MIDILEILRSIYRYFFPSVKKMNDSSDEASSSSEDEEDAVTDGKNRYEQERNERIARNRKMMEDMGILESKKQLELAARRAEQGKKKPRPPSKPAAPSIVRRSSRLDPNAKIDYKEESLSRWAEEARSDSQFHFFRCGCQSFCPLFYEIHILQSGRE